MNEKILIYLENFEIYVDKKRIFEISDVIKNFYENNENDEPYSMHFPNFNENYISANIYEVINMFDGNNFNLTRENESLFIEIANKLGMKCLKLRIHFYHLINMEEMVLNRDFNKIKDVLENGSINDQNTLFSIIKKISTRYVNLYEIFSKFFKENFPQFLEKFVDTFSKISDKFEKIKNNVFIQSIINDDENKLQESIIASQTNLNSLIYFPFINNKCSITLIGCCALFGSIKCFKYLLLNGANLEIGVNNLAAAGGNMEIIKICEQNGYPVSQGALYMAISYHKYELFKKLYFYGEEFHPNSKYDNLFLISSSAKNCSFKILEYLIQQSNNWYEICELLLISTRHNNWDLFNISLILNYSDNFSYIINLQSNHSGKTPLHYACKNGNLEMVKILLGYKGINIELKDKIYGINFYIKLTPVECINPNVRNEIISFFQMQNN